jgi:hypothetical protein
MLNFRFRGKVKTFIRYLNHFSQLFLILAFQTTNYNDDEFQLQIYEFDEFTNYSDYIWFVNL